MQPLVNAGLLSLTDMTKRLQQDHDNALLLARGLAACPHVEIRTDLVRKGSARKPCPFSTVQVQRDGMAGSVRNRGQAETGCSAAPVD